MINQKDLEDILLQNKILDQKQLKKYQETIRKSPTTLEDLITEEKIISPALLYEMAAKFYKLPFIHLKDKTIRKDILFLIPEITARSHQTIAFDKTNEDLMIATLDISNIELFDFLAKKTQLNIKLHITTPEDINDTLKYITRA